MTIKNIVFDLGGVLLNLDFEKSFAAFEALGVSDFQEHFRQTHSNPLFAKLETGYITPPDFYAAFRHETGIAASDEEIASAWNSMLLDFREESVAYLASLKGSYRLFLLSNTNQIHLEAFRQTYHRQFGVTNFDDHFEKAWYSHEMGLRKPGVEIYHELTRLHSLQPQETLFIDDTLPNIEGAKLANWQTCLLGKTERIELVLPALGI